MSRSASTSSPRTARSDVRRNREALLEAAHELFTSDPDVAMYEVARRAGVGQATLYRHFPDRGSLVSALAENLLDGFEDAALQLKDEPDGFVRLLREFIELTLRSGGIIAVLHGDGDDSEDKLEHLGVRLAQLFGPSLRAAQAAGTIREDLTVTDLLMISRMIRGGLENARTTDIRALSERVLMVILDGVSPRPRPGKQPAGRARP